MKKTTKKLLTLGALSTAFIPIATTISCGKEIVEVIVQDNRKKPKVNTLPEMHFNANPTGAFAEVGDTIDLEYTAYFEGGEILGGKTTKTNVTVGNTSDLPHAALAKRVTELNLELNKEQFASVLMPLNYPINEYKGKVVYYKLKVTKLTKKSTNSNTINTKVAEQYDEVLFDVIATQDSDNSLVAAERQYNHKIDYLKEDPGHLKKVYESSIVGMHQGEEKEFHYTYPADFATRSLRNKSVTFLIVLHTIKKAVHFHESNTTSFNNAPSGSFAEIGDTVNLEFTPYFNGTPLPTGKKVIPHFVVGHTNANIDAALAERIKEVHLEVNKEQTIYVLPRAGVYRNKLLTYKIKITSITKAASNHNTVKSEVAQQYDKVKFDFMGFVDSNKLQFKGGTSPNYTINSLKDTPLSFIPGYEAQMIGMHVGESRAVHVTFPANYSAANLRGQSATFIVILHSVEKAVLFNQSTTTPFNATPLGSFAEVGDTVNLEFTPYFNGIALPTGKKVLNNFVVGSANANIDAALAERIKEVHLEVNKEQTIYVLPRSGSYRNKLLTYKIKITSITKAASNHNTADSTITDIHDTVVFDFMGFEDVSKVAFRGGTASNHTINSLNNTPPSFIAGFEAQMIGMHVGETKVVHVTFPANYQQRSLRNKHATFVVILHSIVKHP